MQGSGGSQALGAGGRAKGSRLQAVGAGIKDLFAQWIAGYCVYREGQGI